jgi:hypothetical protein
MAFTIYVAMDLDETLETNLFLASYDVSGSARSTAARVCQIIFGRRRNVHGKAKDEPGFIHRRGVTWIGQSVLILPSQDGEELAARLRSLGVRVALAPVTIPRSSLEAFRRPSA